MDGRLYKFLSDDHRRLDDLLARSTAVSGEVDRAAFTEFRAGLLRHISMEEKTLLPTIRKIRGGAPLPAENRLRMDHGALAALLVPPPTKGIISAIRAILTSHNAFEEGPGGVYEVCEKLAGPELDELLVRLEKTPDVPVSPYIDNPNALEATRRALARAGYRLDDFLDGEGR